MAMEESSILKLSDCNQGEEVLVVKILGTGLFKKRLREMGFTPNVPVKIVRYAPLKDPIEIIVKGAHITVRVVEAEQISVRKGDK